MHSLLEQLGIEFQIQKTFEWSKNVKHISPKLSGKKVYDFFLTKYNTIIETHGIQHYEDYFTRISKRARNSSEEQENDIIKQELAKNNNINNYISVNCRESNMNFIKNSILNCQLNNLFDLSQIDWENAPKMPVIL